MVTRVGLRDGQMIALAGAGMVLATMLNRSEYSGITSIKDFYEISH